MPELPEVETTKRGISPHVLGKKITKVIVRESRFRWPISPELQAQVEGYTVRTIERRAKYLLFGLDHGYFMLHLGMSGSLFITKQSNPVQKHDHVEFYLPNKLSLRFNDPRRFGSLLWVGSSPHEHELLLRLGPEPFANEFNGDWLFKKSRGKKCAVKNYIMDNHTVVGVGNIYANEALFLSGIRPGKAARRISRAQYNSLATIIVDVLNASIDMGGTTLKDFVGGDGKPGYFQQTLQVYGRANKPCRTCQSPIKLIRLGQRSTYYCPQCQN